MKKNKPKKKKLEVNSDWDNSKKEQYHATKGRSFWNVATGGRMP